MIIAPLDSGESFNYKQGYEFAINEFHKQYNLRSKKNVEAPTNKSTQTQRKKIVKAPTTKVLQILPREVHQNSSSAQKNSNPNQKISSPKIEPSPKIVEITDIVVQTSADPQKLCCF